MFLYFYRLKAGFRLVDLFRTKRLFSRQKVLIMENTKSTPQIKSEAVVQRRCVNKVFLETSQNSQENCCARVSFLIEVAALRPVKKRLWHR